VPANSWATESPRSWARMCAALDTEVSQQCLVISAWSCTVVLVGDGLVGEPMPSMSGAITVNARSACSTNGAQSQVLNG